MIANRSAIAIVPARGGSKGLPGKNIKPLCGKPLIVWTIEKALQSAYFDRVIISTDSEDIAAVAERAGAEVPFLRPPELATDTATSVSVVNHALDYIARVDNLNFDYVALLQATSPLREQSDLDTMLTMLHTKREKFDGIIALARLSEHPSIAKKIVGDSYRPFCPDLPQNTRRQDDEAAYYPFGGTYILKAATFLKEQSLYPKRATWFELKRHQAYEIDDIYDFLCVEAIMKNVWGC